jgi:hypothetical protein
MLHLLTEAFHLICLTEYHFKKNFEMDATPIPKYKLGAKYCRMNLKNSGVYIYIQEGPYDSNDDCKNDVIGTDGK